MRIFVCCAEEAEFEGEHIRRCSLPTRKAEQEVLVKWDDDVLRLLDQRISRMFMRVTFRGDFLNFQAHCVDLVI
jgi:GTPase